jgi:hypothetical protein
VVILNGVVRYFIEFADKFRRGVGENGMLIFVIPDHEQQGHYFK